MTRIFVEASGFTKAWKSAGLSDEELWKLQDYLEKNPKAGEPISGASFIRKVRWAAKSKGKRGGLRVCYVDFIQQEHIFLLDCYTKNEKENLAPEEIVQLRALLALLKKSFKENLMKERTKAKTRLGQSLIKAMEEVVAFSFGKKPTLKVRKKTIFDSKKIKEMRKSMFLTQEEFGRIVGVSKKTVESWEYGTKPVKGTAASMLDILDECLK
jgi:DNA-binding transcriptional regulator YiaG